MSKKMTVELDAEAIVKLDQVKRLFAKAGHKGFKQGDLINHLLVCLTDKTIEKYVENNMPFEVKLKQILKDPNLRSKLQKSVESLSKPKTSVGGAR